MRRTLLFVAALAAFSCKSQPAAPTPTATPAAIASSTAATPAASATAMAEKGPSPMDLVQRNVAGMKNVLVESFTWCTFEASGELSCNVGAEGGRDTGRWSLRAGDGDDIVIVGDGARPFEWTVDYVSERVLHLDRPEGSDEHANQFSIYCSDAKDRSCDKWFGPFVGLQDVSTGNPGYAKAKARLGKLRPDWFEGDESAWDGPFMMEAERKPSTSTTGTTIRIRSRYHDEHVAKQLAAELEPFLGRVDIVDESPAPYDLLVVVGNGMTRSPRLRVAVRDGVCTESSSDECSGFWDRQILELATTEKFVALKDGRVKEARQMTEIWFMPGREAEAEELRTLLSGYTNVAPKKWEWGGDFDLLVIAGRNKPE